MTRGDALARDRWERVAAAFRPGVSLPLHYPFEAHDSCQGWFGDSDLWVMGVDLPQVGIMRDLWVRLFDEDGAMVPDRAVRRLRLVMAGGMEVWNEGGAVNRRRLRVPRPFYRLRFPSGVILQNPNARARLVIVTTQRVHLAKLLIEGVHLPD